MFTTIEMSPVALDAIELGLAATAMSAKRKMNVIIPDDQKIVPFMPIREARQEKAQLCATAAFCRRWSLAIKDARSGNSTSLLIEHVDDQTIEMTVHDDDYHDIPALAIMGISAAEDWIRVAGPAPSSKLTTALEMKRQSEDLLERMTSNSLSDIGSQSPRM